MRGTLTPSGTSAFSSLAAMPWRWWSCMDSYLSEQVFHWSSLCVALFSVVLFFSDTLLDLLKEVHRFALPVEMVVQQLVLYFPLAISLAIPASIFLGVLLAYNQLNQHFELIALRLHGISLRRLMVPALLMGVLGTGLCYWVTNHVVPWAQYRSNVLKLEALGSTLLPNEQSQFTWVLYEDNGRLSKIIYVANTKNRQLNNVVFIDVSEPDTWQVVQAMKGNVEGTTWHFENANIYEIFKKGNSLGFSHIAELQKTNLLQADDKLEELQGKLLSTKTMGLPQFWQLLQSKQAAGTPEPPKQYIRFWERLTLPLSCLPLALVAVCFAMPRPRTSSEKGYVLALLALLGFYLLRSFSVALGQGGLLTLGGLLPLEASYAVACWLPLGLMLVLAFGLIAQKNRVL